MPVFVTSAAGLRGAYGTDGYTLILQQLDALVVAAASKSSGSRLLVLDEPSSMQASPVADGQDAASMRMALAAAFPGGTTPDGVVIIGDQRVVPSFSVTNPVTDRTIDPDVNVLTDNPYGYFSSTQPADCLIPPIPVGRIAGGVDGSAQDFSNLLNWQTALRNQSSIRTGYIEIASRQWQDASSFVLSSVGVSRVFISPDSVLNATNASNLDCKYLYCNLHGFANLPAWMGYDPGLGYPVIAVTPDAFQPQYMSGTVAFTEACYGLSTYGKATYASCALSLLAAGAAGVVGSTGLAFGTATVKPLNVIDADALAQGFFNNVLQPNKTIGQCLIAARNQLSQTTPTDMYVRKTLLEFQLLGDPTYVLS